MKIVIEICASVSVVYTHLCTLLFVVENVEVEN